MYRILIDYGIGDYISDKHGKVYELTNVSMEIFFDPDIMQDVAILEFTAVDARDPENGTFYVFDASQIRKASNFEVDVYVHGVDKEVIGLSSELYDSHSKEELRQLVLEGLRNPKGQKLVPQTSEDLETQTPEELEIKEPRTVNEMLDEFNDQKTLIEMFGDKEGHYKQKMDEILEELNQDSDNE